MRETERHCMVSVIMPAYQAEKYIEEAIRSVIAQTVTDWELLVLIDGSTDATAQIAETLAAEDSRIRVVCNETNLGAAGSRNRGLDLCSGDYAAFLDSDDLWHPQKLEKQIALLRQTGADFSYTSYAIIDENGVQVRSDYRVPARLQFEKMLGENVIGCSTVLLSPKVARTYRFSTEFYHEDYVLWLQLLRDGCRAAGCEETLASWRLNAGSRSFHKGNAAKNRWHIYRNYLKLPLHQSVRAFASYALAGLRKYCR